MTSRNSAFPRNTFWHIRDNRFNRKTRASTPQKFSLVSFSNECNLEKMPKSLRGEPAELSRRSETKRAQRMLLQVLPCLMIGWTVVLFVLWL